MAALLGLGAAGPASAAECRLDRALYSQPESGYTLQFAPVPRDVAGVVGQRFVLSGLENGRLLYGEIVYSNGYGGPMASLSADCVPGSEPQPAACLVWQSFVYVPDGAGAQPLARDDPAAPKSLLLPNLARTVYDRLTSHVGHLPADLFTLAGCPE